MTEQEVLSEQLDELLGEGAVDADDALEIAMVAGMLDRLGTPPDRLAAAVAWRDGPGRELLDEAFDELELDELIEAIDGVLGGDADEDQVEEVLYDFDEVVAAAIWAGKGGVVRRAAHEVAQTIRQVPDPFAPLADVGSSMARLPAVGAHYDLYAFWMAVADAAAH